MFLLCILLKLLKLKRTQKKCTLTLVFSLFLVSVLSYYYHKEILGGTEQLCT
jgi:hypothetical protein